MKTAPAAAAPDPTRDAAPIVQLAGVVAGPPPSDVPADTSSAVQAEFDVLHRARAFAEPLLAGERFDTGEDALAHADGVAAILAAIGAAPSMRAAAYLIYAGDYLVKPEEAIAKAWGESYARA